MSKKWGPPQRKLRLEYDYILIDSRTGLSDTSGICTVQMPDELVVCFTLNQQSVRGAAAVAESAWTQRLKPSGEPGLKIWPVPMRVELGEKDRLARAREFARQTFEFYAGHLRSERSRYWEEIEVLYEPFYAYEEVLAPFAERHRTRATLLRSMETLATRLAGSPVEVVTIPDESRLEVLKSFAWSKEDSRTGRGTIVVSALALEPDLKKRIIDALEQRYPGSIDDGGQYDSLLPGDDYSEAAEARVRNASVAVIVIGSYLFKNAEALRLVQEEVRALKGMGVPTIPLVDKNAIWPHAGLLPELENTYPAFVSAHQSLPESVFAKIDRVWGAGRPAPDMDSLKPGKGSSGKDGRKLTATVVPVSSDWFDVKLSVERTNGSELSGFVQFQLDPAFVRPVEAVPVRDGKAVLQFGTWGAFTVSAVADDGRTRLELNLASLPDAPERFRKG
ncbi:MAG: pYEATS domain-containing protein [Bryobacteraceae bacterium]